MILYDHIFIYVTKLSVKYKFDYILNDVKYLTLKVNLILVIKMLFALLVNYTTNTTLLYLKQLNIWNTGT